MTRPSATEGLATAAAAPGSDAASIASDQPMISATFCPISAAGTIPKNDRAE